MFLAMKCLQPTRSVVGRANGYHVYAQSHGRSLRAVASAVGQWSSSMVTSLSWRSAIVELSQFLTPASSSRGRLIWSPESRGQLCVWSKEHLVESCVFSVVIGVFAGLTSASVPTYRKRASHSRIVKDAARWRRRLDESQSGQDSREAPGPSVPGRVRFARKESREDFRKVLEQLLDPSELEIHGVRWLLSQGKHDSSRSTFHLMCCSIC